MTSRRGSALLAALWLVILMAGAGLQLASVSRERRALGLTAADRTRARFALQGAMAQVHAHLDATAVARTTRSRDPRGIRPAALVDPWQSAAARLRDPLAIGEVAVSVRFTDLGTVLNVNDASELELTTLFSAVFGDGLTGARLAQALLDWRDPDDLPRTRGAEAAAYREAARAALPTNAPLRSVDELVNVLGFSPDIVAAVRPYLTVYGPPSNVNLNAAPEPVLRTVPGMTPPLLAAVLALRSAGRRVESIPALITAVMGRGGDERASAERMAAISRFENRVATTAERFAVEFTTVETPGVAPMRATAVYLRERDGTAYLWGVRW